LKILEVFIDIHIHIGTPSDMD